MRINSMLSLDVINDDENDISKIIKVQVVKQTQIIEPDNCTF
jgi:hypothetical protein